MSIVGQTFTALSHLYSGMNKATLSGAIDVVVVRQPDGSLKCSPFHVRFGKLNVWAPAEKRVKLWINGQLAPVEMKLGPGGEAFFVSKVEPDEDVAAAMLTSPLTVKKDGRRSSVGPGNENPPSPPHPVQFRDSPLSTATVVDPAKSAAAGDDAATAVVGAAAAVTAASTATSGGDTPAGQGADSGAAESVAIVMGEKDGDKTLVLVPVTPSETLTHGSPTNLRRSSEADVQDPISSWRWGALPEQNAGGKGWSAASRTPRRRLDSESSTASDGAQAPGFQVVNLSKNQLQSLEWRPAQSGRGVELAADAECGASVKLAEGDALLSINGIGTDKMDVNQVSLLVQSVGTDSVELVFSVGPMLAKTHTWIRHLGRAFRDFSVADTRTTDGPDSAVGHTSPPPVAGGGVAMSLCGRDNLSEFEKHRVSYSRFASESETLLKDPALVVMIGGDAYGWEAAAPLLLSVAAFGRVPPSATALEQGGEAVASLAASEEVPTRSWWFFGSRSERPSAASPPTPVASAGGGSAASTLAATAAALAGSVGGGDDPQQPRTPPELTPTYSKSLTLDSDGLKSLNLKPGENEAVFCVTSKMQGRATVQCVVHLWEHDEQVVISDIDGTITRSDIMGHAASILGRDWTHKGVAGLFTMISKNGYKFLYLTSRSISHAPLTREYLSSVEQDRGTKLPVGPIFFSPDNFLASFHREVIARNPQEFKTACLQSVAALFPNRGLGRPFVAGFGNRHTDEVSYAAVDVPPDRVFTIDPSGTLKMGTGYQQSSYVALQERIDLYFPPVNRGSLAQTGLDQASKSEPPPPKKFSDVAYWNPAKDYAVNIDDEMEALLGNGTSTPPGEKSKSNGKK